MYNNSARIIQGLRAAKPDGADTATKRPMSEIHRQKISEGLRSKYTEPRSELHKRCVVVCLFFCPGEGGCRIMMGMQSVHIFALAMILHDNKMAMP